MVVSGICGISGIWSISGILVVLVVMSVVNGNTSHYQYHSIPLVNGISGSDISDSGSELYYW